MREYGIGLALGLDASLPDEDMARLARLGRQRQLPRGAAIYRQGEAAAHVYLLVSGRVKSVMVNSAGQEALLRLHLPGNVLGLTALASTPVRDAGAVVTEPATLVEIPRAVFLDAVTARPETAGRLVRLLVDRMSDFHHRVGEVAALSVEQRVVRALLSLSRPDPRELGPRELDPRGLDSRGSAAGARPVDLTHEEFAHLLGARRPTVSAALNRLAQAGLVRRARGRIEVVDRDGLAALLSEGQG